MAKPQDVIDAKLQAMMIEAHGLMRANKPTQSVAALTEAFAYLLELKPELIEEQIEPRPGFKMPFLSRWPQLGANWKAGSIESGKPEFEVTRDSFALSEAITYYEFTLETAISRGA